ncbi:terminase large subunit [Rubellimicrobium arenae]|uniref:terminase large subunit n=1 Tax=Rubellimicrobium arenae TaxID=2817372 RepID=UPI001B31651B|nr:terminase large subunit [Rubellimicrobium arenae]
MPFDFSVPDWEDKLRSGQTPIPQLPINAERAAKAVRIFNELRLPDVPGQPKLEDAAGEWFRDLVRMAFAAEDPETLEPLINEVFCLVPKKNSKTTYSAALGLTALQLWDLPNAQMLILGPTQNVANRCFDQAAGMIKANPKLAAIFHVAEHLKTITRIKTGATLQVKTFDLNVVTGEIPALTIIDELHVVAAKAYAERVIAQITGGMITNPAALLVYITTQSDTEPQGAFKTKLDYARKVRDGEVREGVRLLPILYEFPPDLQADESKPWHNPDLWPMVLPNLGLSVRPKLLYDLFLKAKEEGPDAEIVWASQHLNIQIGQGIKGESWPGVVHWAKNALDGLDLQTLLDRSEVCTIGVDWGGADDLASLVVLGRARGTKEWLAWSRSWARPTVFEQRKKIAARLRDFEADGDLRIVETPDQQAREAAEICRLVADAGLLPAESGIGLDSAGVALLVDELEAQGLVQPQVVAVAQGWKLQTAVSTLPLKLEAGRLRHAGQRIMGWAVGNAKQELRGSNYVVTKQAAGAAKIDPVMALFDAAMLMFQNPQAAPVADVMGMIA